MSHNNERIRASRYLWSLGNHYVLLDTPSDGPNDRVSSRAANGSRTYRVTRKSKNSKQENKGVILAKALGSASSDAWHASNDARET